MNPLVVLLVAVTGCSVGGGAQVASGVTKADFLGRAEAICAQANSDQDALATPTVVDALAPYVARIVAIADRATTQIGALDVPAGDREQLERKVLTPLKQQLEVARDYAADVRAADDKDDQVALIDLLNHPPTKTRADLVWMKSYGFTECVESADTSG